MIGTGQNISSIGATHYVEPVYSAIELVTNIQLSSLTVLALLIFIDWGFNSEVVGYKVETVYGFLVFVSLSTLAVTTFTRIWL